LFEENQNKNKEVMSKKHFWTVTGHLPKKKHPGWLVKFVAPF